MKRLLTACWRIIKKNAGSLFLFEILYRIPAFCLIYFLAGCAVRFSLEQQGYSYMTAENYTQFIRHPITLLLIALCGIVVLAVLFLEMMALFTCFEASWRKEKCSAAEMFVKGAARMGRFLKKRPVFWIFGILGTVPAAHLYLVVSESANLRLLSVTIQKIYKASPKGIFLAVCIAVALFSIGYTYLLPYLFAEGQRFAGFRARARTMWRNGWRQILLSGACAHLAVFALTAAVYLAVLAGFDVYILIFKEASVRMSAALIYGQWLKKAFGIVWGSLGFTVILGYVYASYLVYGSPEPAKNVKKKKKRRMHRRVRAVLSGRSFAAFLLALIVGLEGGYLYSISAQGTQVDALDRSSAAVTAHRGGAKMAPENTISALEYSVKSMSDYAEIDVQETKDGEIVLLHDNNLKRTTGMNRNIWELDYAEVEQLDAGIKFNKNFRGEKIPTLKEAIEYADGKINLNIEIKYNGHNENIVNRVVKIITDCGFEENCVLTSMNYGFLKEAKQLNPDIRTGYTMTMTYGDLSELAAADAFSVKYTYISESFVESVHALGKEVYAWTLNYKGDMKRMIDCGVDNVITDDPELVHQVLLKETDSNPGFFELMRYMMK